MASNAALIDHFIPDHWIEQAQQTYSRQAVSRNLFALDQANPEALPSQVETALASKKRLALRYAEMHNGDGECRALVHRLVVGPESIYSITLAVEEYTTDVELYTETGQRISHGALDRGGIRWL